MPEIETAVAVLVERIDKVDKVNLIAVLAEYVKQMEVRFDKDLQAERELREMAERFVAKALEDQAREYSRRLEILNGENKERKDTQNTFLRIDLFDEHLKSEATAHEEMRRLAVSGHEENSRKFDEFKGESIQRLILLEEGGKSRDTQIVGIEHSVNDERVGRRADIRVVFLAMIPIVVALMTILAQHLHYR